VKIQLERGRKMLGDALTRRGCELGMGLLAVAAASAARASSPRLVEAILAPLSGSPRAAVAALAREVSVNTLVNRSLGLGLVALALVWLGVGVWAARPPAAGLPSDRGQTAKTKPAAENEGRALTGRVVGPDGKPVEGARVYFARYVLRRPPAQPSPVVTSDAQGRFRLRVSRTGYPEEYMKGVWMQGAVVAVGQGNAFGWAGADSADKLTNVTIKLSSDVPITGRVLDLQGKPIAGVSVQVRGVRVRQDGGDLKDLVERLNKRQDAPSHPEIWLHPAPLGVARSIVTGADGKFRITGIRSDCLVRLRFAGPTIETAEVFAVTRPAPTIVTNRVKNGPGMGKVVFHGNTFEHAAAPTRPIKGVVRDRDTGKPLAGVTIRARMGSPRVEHFVGDPYLDTFTDPQGRYRLVGLTREGGIVWRSCRRPDNPTCARPGNRRPAAASTR
jgi:hypothetical protein